MGLTGKQKRLLRKKIRKQSLEQTVKQLKLDQAEAVKYLKKLGYQVKERQEEKEEKQWLGLRQWVRQNRYRLAFLAGLVLLVYVNAWGAEFVSDDVYGISNNQYIGDWGRVFGNPIMFIRPLYYRVIYHWFGLVPAAFRSINIVSHVLMAVVIFLLVELIVKERRIGFLAGILTAVHPIMVESVTWISGGGHSQYSLLAAISLALYILAGKNRKYYWWSVISFLMALLFSEKAASFPGILLLYQLLFDRKRKWWELVPFFGLSGTWTYLNLRKVPARLGYLREEFASGGKPVNPWLQLPVAIASYLGLIFWPDKLTLYHSEVMVSPAVFTIMTMVTGLVAGLGLVSFWLGLKGKQWAKQVCFWLGMFVIALLPTLLP